MQKVIYLVFLISVYQAFGQRGKMMSFLSPGYSFSSVTIEPNRESSFSTVSHALSLCLLRYGTFFDLNFVDVDISADATVHYVTTSINSDTNNVGISYLGLSPGMRANIYFTDVSSKFGGIYIGGGVQSFVLPLVEQEGINVTTFRPLLILGVRKKGWSGFYGFNIVFGKQFVSGTRAGLRIPELMYTGIELELLGFTD